MMTAFHKDSPHAAGAIVYLRLRVVGFDDKLKPGPVCIVEPVDRNGKTIGNLWYYVEPGWPVAGGVTVAEIEEYKRVKDSGQVGGPNGTGQANPGGVAGSTGVE